MLKLEGVSKSFGNIKALQDISFEVKKGEFVFLTGPSGAGKTTIIKLILRDLLPDKGTIVFNDLEMVNLEEKEIPEVRQKMGIIFQDFKVLKERTLRENIEVALAVIGLEESQWQERVEEVLKLVGLTERADLFPAQLSGGELQRLSLARALVVDPVLIIADEPTGNLDWETSFALMDLFEKINKAGKTILMATHHQGIVDKLKKRNIKIKEGKMVGAKKEKEEKKEESKEEKKEEDSESPEKTEKDGGSKVKSKRPKVKVEEVD